MPDTTRSSAAPEPAAPADSIDSAPSARGVARHGAPVPPAPEDPAALLLRFVHERDLDCPRCGYNLRNLTKPVCPECREPLSLKVGVEKVRLIWLLATLAPGFFSGIAAAILLYPIIMFGPPPMEVYYTCAFGIVSGFAALVIALRARGFIRLRTEVQVTATFIVWTIHLVAFAVFINNI